MPHLDEILHRKQRLITRCAVERATIAGAFRDLERPIAMVDRASRIMRFLRSHPLLVGAAVTAIMMARRRSSLMGMLASGVGAWRMWRSIETWARRLGVDFSRGRRRGNAGHAAS